MKTEKSILELRDLPAFREMTRPQRRELARIVAGYAPPRRDRHPGRPTADRSGRIYFFGEVDGGPIKIGFSSNFECRLRDIHALNCRPLILLASFDGHQSDEKRLHRRFERHKLHGEWFGAHPEILAEIDSIRS